MDLIILIGLQAAGKSTFARTRFADAVYVSKDAMRNVRNKARRQEAMIRKAFEEGQNVVVDNTNPTLADRQALIALGRAYGARILGYFFSSRVQECLERNLQRTGKARVPDVAIHATRRRLEIPAFAEGFDELYYVTLDVPREDFRVIAWQEEDRDRS